MSRSVSIPYGAVSTAYAAFSPDDPEDHFEWEMCLEDLVENAQEKYPSFYACNKWFGREERGVLENALASIVISEYNGIVAVSIVPKEDYSFSESWASKVNLKSMAECFGSLLNPGGRFSNGEQMFYPAKSEDLRGDLGLGIKMDYS